MGAVVIFYSSFSLSIYNNILYNKVILWKVFIDMPLIYVNFPVCIALDSKGLLSEMKLLMLMDFLPE